MSNEDPHVVRAVIERHMNDLEADVRRIDNDHAAILHAIESLATSQHEVAGVLRNLDTHLRVLLAEPAKLDEHWKFGQAIILKEWLDGAARKTGYWLLGILFAAALSGAVAWSVLRNLK